MWLLFYKTVYTCNNQKISTIVVYSHQSNNKSDCTVIKQAEIAFISSKHHLISGIKKNTSRIGNNTA